MQSQDYNPFGKAGSGAPNQKGNSQNIATVNQNQSYIPTYPCNLRPIQLNNKEIIDKMYLLLLKMYLRITEMWDKTVSISKVIIISQRRSQHHILLHTKYWDIPKMLVRL